ncbi:MAG: hypothetical protein OXR66_06105 [Candidatus Woesearchaeota archaeon]|nr:hypothetical protein [Candidatus Woesearchaeota archaeon]
MRGGQVTLFVIVGLALFFAVAILYLFVSAREEIATTDVNVVSSTITTCVDTIVHDELQLIGNAGGTTEFTGREFGIVGNVAQRKILYAITKNAPGPLLPEAHPPPRYPENGVTIATTIINPATGMPWAEFQDGYFGDVNFPAICTTDGRNKPGSTFSCKYYENNPPGTKGTATQALLEQNIAQRLQGCVNPDALSTELGQTITAVGDVSVSTLFTFTNLIVNISYPVTVEDTIHLSAVTRTYKVRYLPLARYAIELARKETQDITFNIVTDYASIPSYKPGFIVQVSRNVPTDRPADLVTITDEHSSIDGTSYMFSFLVEHRTPMLQEIPSGKAEDVTADGRLHGAQIAMDPDESDITIHKIRDNGFIKTIEAIDEDGEKDWQDV